MTSLPTILTQGYKQGLFPDATGTAVETNVVGAENQRKHCTFLWTCLRAMSFVNEREGVSHSLQNVFRLGWTLHFDLFSRKKK